MDLAQSWDNQIMTASQLESWRMAMYYYASKISAIACGTRSKQAALKKSRGQRDRDKYLSQTSKQFVNMKDLNFDKMEIHYTPKKVSAFFSSDCHFHLIRQLGISLLM